MESEKREYQRIKIDAISQFFVSNEDRYEGDFEGIIDNISEEGIGVIISDPKYFPLIDSLDLKKQFFFQAIDEYTVFRKETSDVFQGKAMILRTINKEDHYYLGCKITDSNHELQEYISRRKIAFFIDGMATQ